MSLSQPEFAAEGKTIGALVYFSSASENTARFVAGCRLQDEGINVYRIPLRAADPALNVREPYVIMVPTYAGGVVKKAVPIQVKRFLNDPANRECSRRHAQATPISVRPTVPPETSSPAKARCPTSTVTNSWAPRKTLPPCETASSASSPNSKS